VCDAENGYLALVIIYRESLKDRLHTVLHLCEEASYPFLCPTLYTYRVGHQSPVTLPSRISRMACSSGTTSLSPLWSAALPSS
jgi:hypothetical protein